MNYKELAFSYFRGDIPGEDERVLNAWMKEDDRNAAQLREWEKEWLGSESDSQADQWARMLGRIAVRQTVEEGQMRLDRPAPRRWGAVAAVAATLAVIAGLFFLLPRPQATQLYAMEAPAGEKCRVALPDNSIVWLNSGSKLSFEDSYNRKERTVTLIGEGYFDVAPDADRPFTVRCGDVSVLVKGTRFNVSAYPEDRYVMTSVVEGHVVFSDGTAWLDLYKGQSAHYDLLAGRFSRSLENPDDVCAWTESRFVYDNINLVELADKLSRTYAVQFHFNTPDYLDYKFNISLRNNETLADVLSALERIIPVKTRIEGDNVYVDKK